MRTQILHLIDERRSAEKDEGIGGSIERRIVNEEIARLEGIREEEFVALASATQSTGAVDGDS